MSFGYKTILAHFDSTPRSAARLSAAAHLADSFEAHLAAVYSIMSPLYSEPFVADGGAFVQAQKSSGVKSFVQITQDLKPYMGQ